MGVKKKIGGFIAIAFFMVMNMTVLPSCKNETTAVLGDTTESVWYGWGGQFIKPYDTLVKYGHELIANTSYYLGPKGIVSSSSNGMNCQNCHLAAGTVPWGNNYSAVVSTYPKFRERSGGIETIPKRVNDCIERSLNGKSLDSNSREMKAIIAYMQWVGDGVKKGKKPKGSGLMDIEYLNRPADPQKGLLVYESKCQRCHMKDGQGQINPGGYGYNYPPLWGVHSYNDGAGLFRLSRLAGYVKNNMPYLEVTYLTPMLTDEECWDVAAFINTQPRPKYNIEKDWPDISKKPIDHPFGPYTDGFTESQHKLGPFKPIKEARKKMGKEKVVATKPV